VFKRKLPVNKDQPPLVSPEVIVAPISDIVDQPVAEVPSPPKVSAIVARIPSVQADQGPVEVITRAEYHSKKGKSIVILTAEEYGHLLHFRHLKETRQAEYQDRLERETREQIRQIAEDTPPKTPKPLTEEKTAQKPEISPAEHGIEVTTAQPESVSALEEGEVV
jgi:hypothetical protein